VNITIRSAVPSDGPAIMQLGDRVFGEGCLSGWTIPNRGLCLVATISKEIIGMIDIRFRPNAMFLSVFIVDDSYQRNGIGSSLYSKALRLLSKTKLSATCWKESPNPGIVPFLKKKGWKVVSVMKKYWYKDSLDKKYQCIRCGNPCLCSAVTMNLDPYKS
jgi:GNAT superfamily N-acetyltransferase